MLTLRDEFLSEEDLALAELSDAELDRAWTQWLHDAQVTNDEDRWQYSHGVFTDTPSAARPTVRQPDKGNTCASR